MLSKTFAKKLYTALKSHNDDRLLIELITSDGHCEIDIEFNDPEVEDDLEAGLIEYHIIPREDLAQVICVNDITGKEGPSGLKEFDIIAYTSDHADHLGTHSGYDIKTAVRWVIDHFYETHHLEMDLDIWKEFRK